MPRIEAHGLTADAPSGWDAQIYVRDPLPPDAVVQRPAGPAGPGAPGAPSAVAPVGEQTFPICHLANFPLPANRADYGGGAVELMESGGVFIAVIEYEPEAATSSQFAHPIPWPLTPDDFDPQQMQRTLPGQAGCQRFFTTGGRAFCLYVVIGSYRSRAMLTKVVNSALASFTIS